MKRFFLRVFFFLCISGLSNASINAQSEYLWKVGISKVNITPQEPMWMAGYAFRDKPSEGKRTDLWSKALVVEDEKGNRAIFISLDLVNISKELADHVKMRLKEKFGFSKGQIILNVSHTHTGPESRVGHDYYGLSKVDVDKVKRYANTLEDKIVTVATNALQDLTVGKIFSGVGVTRFQVNRRNNDEKELPWQTELNGPNDYSIPVLKIVDLNNNLKAILFSYACHNTTLRDYKWSGDYAGFAQIELENTYPGTTALFFQGAGGDQNPLPRGTASLAMKYGRELAVSVSQVIDGADEMEPLESDLSINFKEIELGYAKPPPTKEELIRIMDGSSKVEYPKYKRILAKEYLKKLRRDGRLKTYYPYPIQVWRLGTQSVFALGGELTIGYAIELKRIFGQDIFVFGYNNGAEGYIPTSDILIQGGYEALNSPMLGSPWEPNIENKILLEASKLAREIGVKNRFSR